MVVIPRSEIDMGEPHGSWLKPIADAMPAAWHGFVDLYVVNTWLIIAILVTLAWLGSRNPQRVPRGLQNFWEIYITWVRNFCCEQIGPNGARFAPMLGTLFLYILLMNQFGLVPGFLTPTMSLNVTIALALSVFLAIQWAGFAERGFFGYLKHFVGQPWWLFWISIPVHIIGELAKPLSLSIRLFGNMFGEETAIYRMLALGAAILPFTYVPIPVHFINVLIHMIIGPIQAFIFFILSAAYIEMAVSSHSDHDHAGDDPQRKHEEVPEQSKRSQPEAA